MTNPCLAHGHASEQIVRTVVYLVACLAKVSLATLVSALKVSFSTKMGSLSALILVQTLFWWLGSSLPLDTSSLINTSAQFIVLQTYWFENPDCTGKKTIDVQTCPSWDPAYPHCASYCIRVLGKSVMVDGLYSGAEQTSEYHIGVALLGI